MCLAFPGCSEEPHFEKMSFRVKKKIVATYDDKNKRACVKLTIEQQDLFSLHDKEAIYPVPNSWGKQGWTFIDLKLIRKDVLNDILKSAYDTVNAVKKK